MSISITTKDLVKRYRQRTVVNHVSIDVKQGEIVGLLGPNGAGKTTTFYQVVGLIKPDEGNVFLNDIDITKLPMYKRAKMGIGYLPQRFVFPRLPTRPHAPYAALRSGRLLFGILTRFAGFEAAPRKGRRMGDRHRRATE